MTNELSAKLMQKNSMRQLRQLRQLRHFKSNDLSENEQIRQKCLKSLMQIFIQAAWYGGQWKKKGIGHKILKSFHLLAHIRNFM